METEQVRRSIVAIEAFTEGHLQHRITVAHVRNFSSRHDRTDHINQLAFCREHGSLAVIGIGIPHDNLSCIRLVESTGKDTRAEAAVLRYDGCRIVTLPVGRLIGIIEKDTECHPGRIQGALYAEFTVELNPHAIATAITVAVVNVGGLDLRNRRQGEVDALPGRRICSSLALHIQASAPDFTDGLHIEYRTARIQLDFGNGVAQGVARNQGIVIRRRIDNVAALRPFVGILHINLVGLSHPHGDILVQVQRQCVARDRRAQDVSERIGISQVRQLIGAHDKVNVLELAVVRNKRHAQVVNSRSKAMGILDGFLVDRELVKASGNLNATKVIAGSIQRDTFRRQVSAIQHVGRCTAFKRKFLAVFGEVASQLVPANLLPDFPGDDVRIVGDILQQQARLGLQVNRGMHAEVRLARMAFRIENVEVVGAVGNKAERIQVDGSRHLTVLTTDVHHQLVVNKHPHVVVTVEVEVLARHIFEGRLDLHSKAEVVALQIIVVGVRDGLGAFIQVLEVVQQEHTALALTSLITCRNVVLRDFGQPEAFLVHGDIEVAAGHVGKRIALGIDSKRFREEPVS